MKKCLTLVSMTFLLTGLLAACSSSDANTSDNNDQAITVISREDGSGTRGAFVELFGIEEKNSDGEKIDNTLDSAEITNNTSVMMTTIAGDEASIGYISLGSLNDTVKALSIDGVNPSVETVKDKTYSISRPFNIATKGTPDGLTQDFMDYILSTDGQKIVEENGYISIDSTKEYEGNKPSGSIIVAGSSSVTPVMEALQEAYEKVNPKAKIEIQQSDSTTGMNAVADGICDIGMASREIKDSELEKGLIVTPIALDGIAVIVNKSNSISDLTIEQVKEIYTGKITYWTSIK